MNAVKFEREYGSLSTGDKLKFLDKYARVWNEMARKVFENPRDWSDLSMDEKHTYLLSLFRALDALTLAQTIPPSA